MNALTRRMVTGDDAVETASQHRKPCADCPFARTALNGWLGTMTIREWIAAAHGESLIDCHCTTNQQCAGAAIFRSNICKMPKDPRILRLPSDRALVFSWDNEFIAHHSQKIKLKKQD